MSAEKNQAVFLSYASQDAEAAQRICDALRAAGVEVWFDQNELVGGDAWDAKIRGQIAACALFVPVISANTQARLEGYFRLEWKLAAQRTHAMAEERAFLLPVVIDATRDVEAKVPGEFRAVQWTRLPVRQAQRGPDGEASEKFCERVKTLLRGASGTGIVPVISGHGQDARATPKVGRRVPAAVWAVAIVAFAVALGIIWPRRTEPAPAPNAGAGTSLPTNEPAISAKPPTEVKKLLAPMVDPKSVAVLPFVNLSGDPAQEYFSDGVTEEILNALMRERDLRVVPRTSAFSFKNRSLPLPEIARALNVAQVVEGSVRRSGNQVRIDCTLTRVADGFTEPLRRVERELTGMTDIFALQDEVARLVVEKLTRRTSTMVSVVPTKNLEAYNAYLRGRAAPATGSGGVRDSIAHFEKAVQLDPSFALAWARLAEAQLTVHGWGSADSTRELLDRARAGVGKAVDLQPNLPEALLARARLAWGDADLTGARRDLERVDSLQPRVPEVSYLRAFFAAEDGDWPAATSFAREALALEPKSGDWANMLAVNVFSPAGDFAMSDRLYAQIAATSPRAFNNRISLRILWRGPAAALKFLEDSRAGPANAETDTWRGLLLLHVGRSDEAKAVADRLARGIGPQGEAGFESQFPTLGLFERTGNIVAARRLAEVELEQGLKLVAAGNVGARTRAAIVHAHLTLGDAGAARKVMQAWAPPDGADLRRSYFLTVAPCHAILGDKEPAIAAIRQSLADGIHFGYWLRFQPDFVGLRDDARFQDMMRKSEAWAEAQPDPSEP